MGSDKCDMLQKTRVLLGAMIDAGFSKHRGFSCNRQTRLVVPALSDWCDDLAWQAACCSRHLAEPAECLPRASP
jgi:hypothetical protein